VDDVPLDDRLNEPWEIKFKGRANKIVTCRNLSKEEGEQRKAQRRGIHIESSADIRVSHRIDAVLLRLEDYQLPEDTPDDEFTQREIKQFTNPDGSLKRVVLPLKLMPTYFQDFQYAIIKQLDDLAKHGYRLLRWRLGMQSSSDHYYGRLLEYSRNAGVWKVAPHNLGVSLKFGAPRTMITDEVRQEVISDLSRIIEKGKKEPIGYSVLYEASKQVEGNPRSALVMGMAALETALKECISALFPENEWFLMNLQSPPIDRILREYLTASPKHRLLFNGRPLVWPTSIMETVKRNIKIRNNIVHGHDQEVRRDELDELLLTVHDLMRMFDCIRGEEWASKYIRSNTVAEIAAAGARGMKPRRGSRN
jgi:hypothetical protein